MHEHRESISGSRRASVKLACGLFCGVAVLNIAFSFHNLWPTPWVTARGELSIEAAVLLLVLSFYSEWRGVPGRRCMYLLCALALLLTLGRYAEVTAPALFGRHINLYWDAQHLPKVVAMFASSASAMTAVATLAGLCVVLTAACALLYLALAGVWAALACNSARRTLAFTSTLCVAAYVVALTPRGHHLLHWFSLPVSATYLQQARFIHDALSGAAVTAKLDQAALPRSSLSGLQGADVMIIFVESYGATAFDEARFQAPLGTARETLASAIGKSGLSVVSAFVTSPTFGGASWLAHSSLMSGIEIKDAASYAMLLTRDRKTLAHRFAERGYRTAALMPGLKQDWPEGSFYDFGQIYAEKTLDYRGPAFGWWRIPDQFALAKFDAMELDSNLAQPSFTLFPTISTHMPFRPTPPYQHDWTRMLTSEPFDADAVQRSRAAVARWSDPRADYADALAYGLTNIAGYLGKRAAAQRSQRELVLVMLGDHQPPASVSGKAASHDVPIHVITSHANIINALLAAGFNDGLKPQRQALMPMHQLAPLLLQVFDTPAISPLPKPS